MESVYFGKESIHQLYPELKPEEKKPREYYFPDESKRKYRIITFFSDIFASALLDIVVLVFIYPLVIIQLAEDYPVFKLITINTYDVSVIGIIYVFTFLLLHLIIHNIGRTKVYVNDNGTFYFLKMTVRVKTGKKSVFTSKETANARIHKNYAKYINRINRQIEKKSLSIYKTLTGCHQSNNIEDDGTYFSGYDEKKLRDEDFKIPSSYIKYDHSASYYKSNFGYRFLFWIIKLVFYALIFAWLVSTGVKRYEVFNECFPEYLGTKTAQLEPLGLEYNDKETYVDHTYDYVEFIDTSDDYLRNSVRIYFKIKEDGIKDQSIDIFYDVYYNFDPTILHRILEATFNGELPDLNLIDETVHEYIVKELKQNSGHISTDDAYFTVNVNESDWADYRVFIFLTNSEADFDVTF